MAEINDKRIPTGTMDSDTELRLLAPTSVRYRLNCHVSSTQNGNDGANENTPGNILIPNNSLPSGQNLCVGSYEDKKELTIIFHNWNSNNNHGIYRYYTVQNVIETILIEPLLDYNPDKLITGNWLIDDIYSWTDNNVSPKVLNIAKANETNKLREFNIYFGNILTSDTYTTTIKDSTGATIYSFSFTSLNNATLSDLVKDYISSVPPNAFATFFSKENYVEVTFSNAGAYTITVTGTNNTCYSVANNFYPLPFKKEYFDEIKYPVWLEPIVTLTADSTRKSNLLQDNVFQFRTRIVFDDNEKTVWSPYSKIVSKSAFCNSASGSNAFNAIDIDFNEPRLFDLSSLSVIKRVDISVRNHNNDKDSLVVSLEAYQFLFTGNIFRFYNDGIYDVIDPAEALKNYDSVPLLSKSKELANNRNWHGGITEGYDPVNVDSKIDVTFNSSDSPQLFPVIGNVLIQNLFQITDRYARFQPIHIQSNLTNNAFQFGGFGIIAGGATGAPTFTSEVCEKYNQFLPLGGFVFYLAGTNYYGISQQIPTGASQQYPSGVYSSAFYADRNAIRTQIENGNTYSRFTINAPAGKYLLRVASHLTTQSELNSGKLDWQKTSTNLLTVAGIQGNEVELEITSTGQLIVNGVVMPSDQINDSIICDLSSGDDGIDNSGEIFFPLNASHRSSYANVGYITDADINPAPSGVALLGDTRIDLAKIIAPFNNIPTLIPFTSIYLPSGSGLVKVAAWTQGYTYTDHNGYYFVVSSTSAISLSDVQTGTHSFAVSDTQLLGNTNFSYHIFRSVTTGALNNYRTKLTGKILLNGSPIDGVSAITTRGQWATSELQGKFSITIYADSKLGNNTRADYVYYATSGGCAGTFTPNTFPDRYSIQIISGTTLGATTSPYSGGTYNFTNLVLLTNAILLTLAGGDHVSLKRGGKYQFGQVYCDEGLRDNDVNTSSDLRVSIPFYTDKNSLGVVIGGGSPILTYSIFNAPPSWAKTMEWVRTLNGNEGSYLQWIIKAVQYVDDSDNPAAFTTATQIKIELNNIVDYKDINPDSQVSYQFTQGDIMIPIKDVQGNFFQDYFEFKLKGTKGTNLLVLYADNILNAGQIKAGTLIEIYNPKKKFALDLYYEMMESLKIEADSVGNLVHKASTQDQKFASFTTNFNDAGNVGFLIVGSHNIAVGDTVLIQQDYGFALAAYNGLTTILSVTPTSITINKPFGANTPLNPGKIVAPAIGQFTTGDTWNRVRNIPYNSTNNFLAKWNRIGIWGIEDSSISDFFTSNDQEIGRFHIINPSGGRKIRPAAIRFSNNYISNTKINGLCSFEGLNEKVLPGSYGYINKLIFIRDTLLSVHNQSEVVSMYIGKNILNDAALQAVVSITDKIIQDSYQYEGGYGSQDSASVVVGHDNNVFGWDNAKGRYWERQVNGLTPISHKKMRSYFNQKAAEQKLPSVTTRRIVGFYDAFYEQAGVSFNELFGPFVVSGLGVSSPSISSPETITWNNLDKMWESFYSFVPEFYGGGVSTPLVLFKDGQLWLSNANPIANNFFGVQYKQKLTTVSNEQPSITKNFLNMSTESTDNWNVPVIKTLEGQTSELQKTDFERVENVYRADFLKDSSTPNVANALLEGDDLRSSVLELQIENDATTKSKLFSVNINSIISNPIN